MTEPGQLAKVDEAIRLQTRRHRKITALLQQHCPEGRKPELRRELKQVSDRLARLHGHRLSLLMQESP